MAIPVGHLIQVRRHSWRGKGWQTAYVFVEGDAQACVREILSGECDGSPQSVLEVISDEGTARNVSGDIARLIFRTLGCDLPSPELGDFLESQTGLPVKVYDRTFSGAA